MRLPFGLSRKAAPPTSVIPARGDGWWPLIRESFTGAWQQNVEFTNDTILAYNAVFACVTLIA